MRRSDFEFRVRFVTLSVGPPHMCGTFPYVDMHCPECDLDIRSGLVAPEETIDAVIKAFRDDWPASDHLQWHEDGCPKEPQ